MTAMRFRLAGIPVRVEPVFFLVMVLLSGLNRRIVLTAAFVAVGFVSILFHELAHAVAFRAYGRSPAIVLHGFGGATSAPGAALSRSRDVLVSAAGPLSQILLLGLPALWLRLPAARSFDSATVYEIFTDAAWINLAWGILNLMPILPLDGGRILAGVLGRSRGGLVLAHGIGVVASAAGVVWGVFTGQIFLAMFAGMFAATNLAAMRGQKDEPVRELIRHGHRSIDAGDSATALEAAARAAGAGGATPAVRAATAELSAWAHLARGDRDAAAAALAALPDGFERSGYLTGAALIDAGDPDAAVVTIARALAVEPAGPPNRLLAGRLVAGDLVHRVAGLARGADDDGTAVAALAEALRAAGFDAEARTLTR